VLLNLTQVKQTNYKNNVLRSV